MNFWLECVKCNKDFDRLEMAFGHAHEISEGTVVEALFVVKSDEL